MKKLAALIFSAALSVCLLTADIYAEARSVILADTVTGEVLKAENENERLPIASVTKIMTLLIAAEELAAGNISLSDTVPVSAYASGMTGSVIWLEPNEQMSLHDLLKSIVISSANDSCVAVAEYISGSEEKFVARMNSRAAELGMTSTHFENCVGYDSENHYSTAADVAVMAAELRKHSVYDEFLLTRLDSVRTGTERETQLLNTNKLINSYNGMTGLKTGTTDGAGYCFAGTARRGEMELVAVVLGCGSDEERFEKARELLDYGFENYCLFTPSFPAEALGEIKVVRGVKESVQVGYNVVSPCIIPKGSQSRVEYYYSVSDRVKAPVGHGDTLGTAAAVLGEKVIARSDIVAAEAVEEMTFIKICSLIIERLFSI